MFDVSQQIKQILPFRLTGRVTRVVGLTASVSGFPAPLGAVCAIDRENGHAIEAEVVGFQDEETLLLPYEELTGIRRGDRVSLIQSVPAVAVGDEILGRVLDGRGRCIDGKNQAMLAERANLKAKPISPLDRPRIDTPLSTGIRTIDGLLTCGKGQRLGIFAGSGVGKSTLMGQMARQSSADVNVVCLVGERGREVREFLDRDLGPEGLSRSVVIVATSDEPALIRLRAAHLATAVSEYFRDCGKDVLLMMDSVTRYALAQREIGLAAGEPPATRGYPPSVFSLLPKLLERSGRTDSGSITGFYTVLVEADDANEPISDTVRGILDGHIMLSRKLAHESHWPAIDVLQSISRSMNDITSPSHQAAASQLKKLMAAYQQSEDLISIGAYQTGSNAEVDLAIKLRPIWNEFLRQGNTENSNFDLATQGLANLTARMEQLKPMHTEGSEAPADVMSPAEAAGNLN
ncbi:FliI/YscN family ATPase [Gimesia chilikensis]|uniref:FliI/YscN family ATPase n=1 Tax=Gimesia chilikensis TaxID=2605989 RepID=UPI0011878407|nr:FliI/YscN family ATPase [Gimesia chilikensis]QDT85210.1 putative ATP synthase YscN [Gimesia chilikensis]